MIGLLRVIDALETEEEEALLEVGLGIRRVLDTEAGAGERTSDSVEDEVIGLPGVSDTDPEDEGLLDDEKDDDEPAMEESLEGFPCEAGPWIVEDEDEDGDEEEDGLVIECEIDPLTEDATDFEEPVLSIERPFFPPTISKLPLPLPVPKFFIVPWRLTTAEEPA